MLLFVYYLLLFIITTYIIKIEEIEKSKMLRMVRDALGGVGGSFLSILIDFNVQI